MNLSISNITFKDDEYEKYLLYLKDNKLFNIEIAPFKHFKTWNPCDQQIDLLKKNNFNIVSMQGLFYNTNINLFFEENKFINHFEKIKKLSKLLNCKYLVFGSPLTRKVTIQKNPHEIFNKIINIIQDDDIKIGLELNPKQYNCNFFNEIEELKKINFNKNVFFHFDIGCIRMTGENPEKIFLENINLIKNIHISEKNLDYLSNSDFNHKNFSNILKNNNFNGNISLEMKESDMETFITNINLFKDLYG